MLPRPQRRRWGTHHGAGTTPAGKRRREANAGWIGSDWTPRAQGMCMIQSQARGTACCTQSRTGKAHTASALHGGEGNRGPLRHGPRLGPSSQQGTRNRISFGRQARLGSRDPEPSLGNPTIARGMQYSPFSPVAFGSFNKGPPSNIGRKKGVLAKASFVRFFSV